ncbi:hypothetical protein [Actinocrispum wychmicini]|uniref:Uncharacterized protein n=1 Tax=Actinocrispum wychmicini TaxID=1213861 RepID=A0A4R2JYH8_9PSEU|nr:hypothetical protein [Actinocrispum wychmicini]TCO64934.1 hypothetical protein EV192_101718 [Actinocrispum wychmicini]
MPRKPTPPPRAELAKVRAAAKRLADLETKVEQARAERNALMAAARQAGATGDQLADAAGIARRNVLAAISAAPDASDQEHENSR